MLAKLRLPQRLLLLWFASTAVVLLVSGIAFWLLQEHEIETERQARIEAAFGILDNQIAERADRLATSAGALAERRSVVATLRLFADYFEPQISTAMTFDPPAQELAGELAELARAAGATWAAIVGSSGTLNGYWREEGAEYKLYVSYREAGPVAFASVYGEGSFVPLAAVPPFLQQHATNTQGAGPRGVSLAPCATGSGPALAAEAPVLRPANGKPGEVIGSVVVGVCLDEGFVEQIAAQTGAAFGIAGGTHKLLSRTMPDIAPPVAITDTTPPAGLNLSGIRWQRDGSRLLGAGDWVFGDGTRSTALFVLDRGDLTAQRRTLITAGLSGLLVTAGIIFVLGMLYLRRTVTQPLEHLMRAVGSARQGRYETVAGIRPGDEIGDLAETFNHMTDRIRSREEELRRLSRAVEQSPASVVITDPQGRIEYVNPRFTEVTGYSANELYGRTPSLLKSGRTSDETYAELWQTILGGKVWRGELFNRVKDGQIICEQVSISPIVDEAGAVTHFVGVKEDITRRKATEEQINHLAYHDALTDLPNRVLFRDRLDQALRRYRRHNVPFALLVLDLDHFKDINDSLGHSAGDELLRLVAQRVKGQLRSTDTFSRLGGDEFGIIQSGIGGPADAAALAIKVIASFGDPFPVGSMRLHSNSSIGIAVPGRDMTDVDELISRADIALYKAKDRGRGGYVYFDDAMTEQVQQDAELTNDLARALGQQQLRLVFQPQIELASGRLVGVEALLRWRHPSLGEVSPGRFIPLAESRGLMPAIGEWVMAEACNQWLTWRDQGLTVDRIAVNVSAAQFKGGHGFESLARAIESCNVPPEALEIEFTESAFMHVDADALSWIAKLSSSGVHFAIDDFGTGYSSLVMLRQFQAHKLKVDQSFVRDMLEDVNDAAIVRATISLAKSIGMIVVAEGIEEAEQAARLREMGCDIGQGYHFARPMPPEEILSRYGKGELPING